MIGHIMILTNFSGVLVPTVQIPVLHQSAECDSFQYLLFTKL